MSANGFGEYHLKEFTYGRSTLEYALIHEERKNLSITVQPDKALVVRAPQGRSLEEVEAKLQKRGQWIIKQINYFDKFHPVQPPRQYVAGETHYYLGRQYRLRIVKGRRESVALKGKFFVVETQTSTNPAHIKNLMIDWYAVHAQMVFEQQVQRYTEWILGEDFGLVEIVGKTLKSRWGTAKSPNQLTFNLELIKTPMQCVNYVIVHELCHLVHPNHDKTFYLKMASILPDWRNRKEQLEVFGAK